MALGYKDLIKTSHLRSQSINIDGLGDVEIHELPAQVIWDIGAEQEKDTLKRKLFIESMGEQGEERYLGNEFYAKIALQGLAGNQQEISEEDLLAFSANTGQSVILKIFSEVLRYNHVVNQAEAVEALQKN